MAQSGPIKSSYLFGPGSTQSDRFDYCAPPLVVGSPVRILTNHTPSDDSPAIPFSMEEPKLPPPAASGTPPVVSPAGDVTLPRGKKRKLDADEFRNSDYYKLRLMVKDLRPLFLEVMPLLLDTLLFLKKFGFHCLL